ncbi:MAG: hypothetical protein ACLQG5_03830 [Methanobacterium sp.]|jgi:hypothetical protein
MVKNDINLNSSQKSVEYFADYHGEGDPVFESIINYYLLGYPSVLIEDVGAFIIPSSRSPWNLNAVLEPQDQKIEDLISKAIFVDRFGQLKYYRTSLSDSLSDFIQDCAKIIMAFGEAIYEIVYYSHPESEEIIEFKLVNIPSKTVEWKENKLMQYIPKKAAQEFNKHQYLELSPENIVFFKPPKYIHWQKMMNRLDALNKSPIPTFIYQNGSNVPYDKHLHKYTQQLAIADTTKVIGWNANFSFQEYIIEFYNLHRFLLFKKFLIILRNDILNKLNECISRVGNKIEFTTKLKIEGLPTLKDVEIMEKQLKEGTINFKKIYQSF